MFTLYPPSNPNTPTRAFSRPPLYIHTHTHTLFLSLSLSPTLTKSVRTFLLHRQVYSSSSSSHSRTGSGCVSHQNFGIEEPASNCCCCYGGLSFALLPATVSNDSPLSLSPRLLHALYVSLDSCNLSLTLARTCTHTRTAYFYSELSLSPSARKCTQQKNAKKRIAAAEE